MIKANKETAAVTVNNSRRKMEYVSLDNSNVPSLL